MSLGKESGIVALDTGMYVGGLQKMQTSTSSSLQSIRQRFDGLKGHVSGTFSAIAAGGAGLGSVLSGIAGGGIIGAGLQQAVGFAQQLGKAMADYIQSGISAIQAQDKLARQIGITREAAVSLAAIGSAGGLSREDLTKSILDVQKDFGQLRQSLAMAPAGDVRAGGDAAANLRRLDIEAERFVGLRFDQQLMLVSERLQGVANAADRAAIGHGIFGREWRDLQPFLSQGSASFQRIQGYAREFGAVASDNVVNSVRGTNAELRELRIASDLAAEGLRVQAASAFLEASQGARSYSEQLRELRRLQPQAAEGARSFGAATGTLNRFINEQLAAHIMPSVRLFNFATGTSTPAAPRPAEQELPSESLAAERIRRAKEDAQAMTLRLRDQANAWGMSAEESQRALLVQRGLTGDVLRNLDRQIERLADLRRAEQEMNRVRELATSAQTPSQNLRGTFREAMDLPAILRDQRNTLLGRAAQGMMSSIGTSQLPQLMERGSVEASSAVINAERTLADPINQLRAAIEAQVTAERELREIGGRIATALEGGGFNDILNGR